MAIIKQGFIVEGTHCVSCEKIIKKQVLKINGVKDVSFDITTETGYVLFNDKKTNIDTILDKIEEKHYQCFILDDENNKDNNKDNSHKSESSIFSRITQSKPNNNSTIGFVFAAIGLAIIVYFLFSYYSTFNLPVISQDMGLLLLFIVGLLTGFHCVGMCGGFVVSYTAKATQDGNKPYFSHGLYGLGKIISYTVIGAIFGLLGSIITFTPMIRGIAGVLAGLFLIIFGLNMLNIFPGLKKYRLRTPKFIDNFINSILNSKTKINSQSKSKSQSNLKSESSVQSNSKSPLVIGLLNGLMIACGPLQAIYIMAAGTGSMIEGAKFLFVFALGTLPVMLGFGFLTSIISFKATQKVLKASGVIVIILGLIMINRGLALTGTGLDSNSLVNAAIVMEPAVTNDRNSGIELVDGYQIINMDVTRNGWEPNKFVLKKDVPVKWVINGKEITGCNNAINVPKYGLEFGIKSGEQIIEFTPTEDGIIPWSCWMGMIRGTFIVKSDIDLTNTQDVQKAEEELNAAVNSPGISSGVASSGSSGGSCGGSCGSPTCGAATGGSCGCGG